MENPRVIFARDLAELHEALRLRPRQAECVKCDDTSQLECPKCPKGESCQYSIPLECGDSCAQAICIADEPTSGADESNNNNGGGDGPNVGAIAGGVIGGVIVIAILTYLAWRFLIKPKRAQEAQSQYEVGIDQVYGSEKGGASGLTRRSSTHTVHSIASTVLTRASNIIQIAYIPGVTNRANPSSSGVPVPPVPPIPMEHSGSNRDSANDDQHFFMPGDLRDSTYSGLSGYSDRTSFARTSYAPRSSVASTIYGKQAQLVAPSQAGMRLKPTMVSVKSVGTTGSGGSTPPVPTINLERFGDRRDSQASTFSVGSTFLNTATQARAHVVKVGSGLRQVEIGSKSDANSSKSTFSNPHAVEKDTDEPSGSITLINDTARTPSSPVDQGPFSDPPESQQGTLKSVSTPTLGAVLEAEPEEEQRAASSTPQRANNRATSPFSDEHATK